MTRDEARSLFASAGLAYADLNHYRVSSLRDLIDAEMKVSGLFASSSRSSGTYRMNRSYKADLGSEGFWVELTCRAFYFKTREAVTFGHDGFIGFAGWSDEINVQPILVGFSKWVDETTTLVRRAA